MRKKYIPSMMDLGVIRSFAHTVESAILTCGKDVTDFCKKVLDTEIFQNYTEDFTVYGRSPNCIAKMILTELKEKGVSVKDVPNDYEYKDVDAENGFWMGYVMIWWMFQEPDAIELLRKVDFERFFDSYDVLHTQDIGYAINFIKEEYLLA